MKNTDTTYIEELASRMLEVGPAYVVVDRDDYEFIKGLYGKPSVAIETGPRNSIDSLINSVQSEICSEDLSTVRALIVFLTTSNGENGMRVNDLQQIDSALRDNFSKDIRILRSLSFDNVEGKHSATLVIWK